MEFDPSVGTEIRKTRPAVVVSNDKANSRTTKVTVVPVALIEPLVKALPDPKDEAKDVEGRDPVQEPGRRGR